MRFFFDNCVSIIFVQALSILAQVQGYELVHLTDRFAADTADEEWIRSLARDGDWVIISGDPRISRGQAQKKPGRNRADRLLLCGRLGQQRILETSRKPSPLVASDRSKSARGDAGNWLFDAMERKGFQADLHAAMKHAALPFTLHIRRIQARTK